jgi:sigma-B regulation protein RsbU (phosphoserine phosphatase)
VKRLLGDLAATFDLEHRVRGVRLGDLIDRYQVDLDSGPIQGWGTPGVVGEVAGVSQGPVYLYYVPHLFPEMEEKLRLAHYLQYHLLPKQVPEGAPLSIAAVLEAYCHLSGDLFGWRWTRDGEFLIWIVDLAGHGFEIGLSCAVIKAIIDSLEDVESVEDLVGELNDSLMQSVRDEHSTLFATGFFMTLTSDGEARYCSAAHPPALCADREGGLRALDVISKPIGMFRGQRFESRKIRLEPDETLFLYTDGLIELTTRSGEQFGQARLRQFLERAQREPQALTALLYREIARDHDLTSLDDDVTYLAARLREE